jgi:hypothetical protein
VLTKELVEDVKKGKAQASGKQGEGCDVDGMIMETKETREERREQLDLAVFNEKITGRVGCYLASKLVILEVNWIISP